MSSFANSAGGTIIYRINENNHVAESLSFVDGSTVTKEWIEQIINSNIHRKIEGLLMIPVRFENNVSKTVYVIRIPESNQAPHMAGNNKYYKRYNFKSVPMEEHEVRNLYNRLQKQGLSTVGGVNYSIAGFETRVLVRNESNSIEDRYKLEVEIPNILIQGRNQTIQKFLQQRTESHSIFSIPNESPLFQDEQASMCPLAVEVTKRTFDNPVNFIIKTKLYFSNGIKSKEFDLREILEIKGKKIKNEMFVERT